MLMPLNLILLSTQTFSLKSTFNDNVNTVRGALGSSAANLGVSSLEAGTSSTAYNSYVSAPGAYGSCSARPRT